MNKTLLRIMFLCMSLFMCYLAIHTSMKSDVLHLPEPVLKEPWFWTTLVDFYFNITVISVWMFYKEANLLRSILWLAAFILLGSIATCFYVFLQMKPLMQGKSIEVVLCRRSS